MRLTRERLGRLFFLYLYFSLITKCKIPNCASKGKGYSTAVFRDGERDRQTEQKEREFRDLVADLTGKFFHSNTHTQRERGLKRTPRATVLCNSGIEWQCNSSKTLVEESLRGSFLLFSIAYVQLVAPFWRVMAKVVLPSS
jgi:hypothetical protein